MDRTQETFRALESTLEKYRMNKTRVSPEDLAGRYRISFQKLKAQLKSDAEEYLTAYCLSGFRVRKSDSRVLQEAVEKTFRDAHAARRAGKALFGNFSIQEFQEVAEDLRGRIQELYAGYFDRHTCIYAAGASWDPGSPQPPLVYNDLVDKFWDDGTGQWQDREKPPGDAILIFILQEGGKVHGKAGLF